MPSARQAHNTAASTTQQCALQIKALACLCNSVWVYSNLYKELKVKVFTAENGSEYCVGIVIIIISFYW